MTDISRRALLCAGASAGILVPLASPLAAPAAAISTARLYRRSRFTPLRKASFKLSGGSRRWSLRLLEVGDLAPEVRGADDCFSLTFRCSTAGPPQGTYSLRRPGFAATTLFVVPSDASRRTYQAVINRAS